MKKQPPYFRFCFFLLMAFAAASVASIALQNLIWVAVALFLFFQLKEHRKFDRPLGFFPAATLVFLATFFISAVVGVEPARSFEGVHKYLTLLLFFLIAAMPLFLKHIQKLLLAFTYGGAFCALVGIGKRLYLHQERIDSFSGDKMIFGGMLMLCLLIQLYFLKKEPKNWLHWLSLALLGPALLFTGTRGAWIGFAVGVILLGWSLNRKWLLIACVAAVASFFILPGGLQERFKSIWNTQVIVSDGLITVVGHERPYLWQSGWRISQDYPLFGIGHGNIGQVYPRYKILEATEPSVPHLHNNFLQILVQNGWLGLLAYLAFIAGFYREALRFKAKDKDAMRLNWSLLCAFTAIWVWGLTEYTFSHQFMNVQFFLLGLQARLWKTA